MNTFDTVLLTAVFMAFLVGVYALIYKGSRPLQPVPVQPTPPRKAAVACLIPVVCTAIWYGTFKVIDFYLSNHTSVPTPLAASIIVFGVIVPWCVGIYSAYRAARTQNKVVRAIGSIEVLVFLLAAALPIVEGG